VINSDSDYKFSFIFLDFCDSHHQAERRNTASRRHFIAHSDRTSSYNNGGAGVGGKLPQALVGVEL
jgi:hypothetical protein